MTIVNTSFHIYRPILDDFLAWLRNSYAASARSAGLTELRLARIDFEPDPETVSLAFSATGLTEETARSWHDGEGAGLRCALSAQFGEKVLFFTTYMEILDL